MSDTSLSLLDALRTAPSNDSWQRLVDIYNPLIRGWIHRQGMSDQDADDVTQEVFVVVMRRLKEFERQPQIGAFRSWLRTITVNCLRDYWRSPKSRNLAKGGSSWQQVLSDLEDPDSGLSRQWNDEHDRHVTKCLLAMLKPTFEAKTWLAFQRVAIEGANAKVVADELGITVNAVFIAKSRVLAKLREHGKGLLD
jgi:RNA polymerase sigma-70 factor (ECF subfamily)